MGMKLFKTENGGLKIGDDIFKDVPNCMVFGDEVRLIIGSTTLSQKRYDYYEKENGDHWADADEIATFIDENFSNGGADGVGSDDVSNIVLTTQNDYDALDPKVSTTLYLIPE
jgi:hypothetical protein